MLSPVSFRLFAASNFIPPVIHHGIVLCLTCVLLYIATSTPGQTLTDVEFTEAESEPDTVRLNKGAGKRQVNGAEMSPAGAVTRGPEAVCDVGVLFVFYLKHVAVRLTCTGVEVLAHREHHCLP